MIEFGKYVVMVLWVYGISLLLLVGIIGQIICVNVCVCVVLQEYENCGQVVFFDVVVCCDFCGFCWYGWLGVDV